MCNAVIKYQEGFVFDAQFGGEGVGCGLRSPDHSSKLPSVSKTARRMVQGSSKRNLPIIDVVLDRFQS